MRLTISTLVFYLIFFLFVSGPLQLLAQSYSTTRYTSENGLPSNNTMGPMFVDQKGQLWFAVYGVGICKYDGHVFTETGAEVADCSFLDADTKGRIWFAGTTNIGFIEKDAVHYIVAKNGNNVIDGYGIFFLSNRKEIWFYDGFSLLKFNEKQQVFLPVFDIKQHAKAMSNKELNQQIDFSKKDYHVFVISEQRLLIFDGQQLLYIYVPKTANRPFIFQNELYYFLIDGNLYRFRNGVYQIALNSPEDIRFIHRINNDTLTVLYTTPKGDFKSVMRSYKGKDLTPIGEIGIPGQNSSNRFCQDLAGNFWLGTESGLLRMDIQQYELTPTNSKYMVSNINAIQINSKGELLFGSYDGGLAKFDGKNTTQIAALSSGRFLGGTELLPNGDILFSFEDPIKSAVKLNQNAQVSTVLSKYLAYSISYNTKGQLMLGTANCGLWVQKKAGGCMDEDCFERIDTSKGLRLQNVLTVSEDAYGRYWMGRASQGTAVYVPELDTVFNYLVDAKAKKGFGTISSTIDAYGGLWLGTTKGLYYLPKQKKIDPLFDFYKSVKAIGADFLVEGTVSAITIVNQRLVFGTTKGEIGIFDIEAFYRNGETRLRVLNKIFGYNGGGVGQNTIKADAQGRVWVANLEGATRINAMAYQFDTSTIQIHIDSMVSNMQSFTNVQPNASFRLSHNETECNLYINYPFDPNLVHEVYYSYSLNGAPFSKPSLSPLIHLVRLPQGCNHIVIRAYKHGVMRGTFEMDIHISPIFYKSWWFLSICGLLILGAIWLKRGNDQRFAQLNEEKNLFQVQAIANQLNPHYINNALSWISNRFYKDQEAAHMIDSLAAHIRIVFQNTSNKRAFHSVAHEMLLVRKYLDVQIYRYSAENIAVSMPDEATLSPFNAYLLPITLVQQHCENASEHGIKGVGGLIKVSIYDIDAHYFSINIEDNGRGRKAAASLSKTTTGRGMYMMQTMIDFYNQKNKYPLKQIVIDDIHQRADGSKNGTRVTLLIPKTYTDATT